MNKIVLVFGMLLLTVNGFAKMVKFAVDMDTFTVSPNGVHVTGDFQALAGYIGGDWTSNETTCTQEGTTTIYSVIVNIPAFSKYEYKFVNGDQFYEVEFVPIESRVGYDFDDNRWLWVDSLTNDTSFVGAIKFAGNAPAGLNLVRFLVDLNNQTAISPRPHLAGNFQNWNPATLSLYSFGDSIFEIIQYVSPGNQEYKFVNGNAWGNDESIPSACALNGNRGITVSKDTVLATFCFGSCTVCNPTFVPEHSLNTAIYLFPNPTLNSTRIFIPAPLSDQYLDLTDLSGCLLQRCKAEKITVVERNALPSGVYFVTLRGINGTICTQKLLLQ